MNPILGYFIIVNLGNGIFGSKYGHTRSSRMYAESMTRVDVVGVADPFIGEFITTWLDSIQPLDHTQARVHISLKPGSTGGQYFLDWVEENTGRPLYFGEAMMYENVLTGSYWNGVVQGARPQLFPA